ncbi:MAG: hypothetical protein ACLUDQ_02405 [Bilophila wadsworthia]
MVLLDGLGTPLYSRYVRHHGQPDKVLCAELEALERTHAGIAAAVTGTGADRVGRLLGACAVNGSSRGGGGFVPHAGAFRHRHRRAGQQVYPA